MVQFYNKYIPKVNLTMAPLFAAIAGKKKAVPLEWSSDIKQAFNKAKAALASTTLLHHPWHDAPIALMTDASNIGMGAVLEQRINRLWHFSPKNSAMHSPTTPPSIANWWQFILQSAISDTTSMAATSSYGQTIVQSR